MSKELAELLFPDVKKTVEYYLKMYPERKLPKGAEVLRLAPSPTGYLHLGHFYSAFIQFLATKKTDGVFYLRLEDTDQKREVKGAGDVAYRGLVSFGIVADEGYRGDSMMEIGEYGPYVQSKRVDIYKTFVKQLVANGRAFPCFCEKAKDKQEVMERREQQLEKFEEIAEKDPCRDLILDEVKKNIEKKKPFAIRLKSFGDGEKSRNVVDLFKGSREIKENAKDIILLKSNGIPPYALAHLCDDVLMRTTKVIRGEDWYPSLPAHIELFEAAGFTPIQYGHAPVICTLDKTTGNKRKLSKRYDPHADMRYYVQEGYPIQSVQEYLLTIANSDFELWRIANPDKSFWDFDFELSKVGSNNPMFDMAKFDNISKNVIAKMTCEQINAEVKSFFEGTKIDMDKMYAVLAIDRETPKPRKDIVKYSDIPVLYSYIFKDEGVGSLVARDYGKVYKHSDSKEAWFARIKEQCGKTGISVRDYTAAIRQALAGRENTVDLYAIMQIIGEKETLKRLGKA